MRILWLCNLVIPEFSHQFNIKQSVFGGWMSGMYRALLETDINVIPVFPIFDKARLKDKESGKDAFYTFHNHSYNQYEIRDENIERFQQIIKTVNPDVIHIWGTEYHWSLEMVRACEIEKCLDRVVVHLQGLMGVCSRHYLDGVDKDNCFYPLIQKEKIIFEMCGRNELDILTKVSSVIGRTEFDKACAWAVNPHIKYNYCNEILRKSFYGASGTWKKRETNYKTIFVSQAGYSLKGFHFLLQALPIVLRAYPETKVKVGGLDLLTKGFDTPYGQYIKDMIDVLGVGDRILFLGMLDEKGMVEKYKQADVFVSPSSIENSSNSICEAMMIGTPVVASAVGGNLSIIKHGVNGYLYPCDDFELMAYYIIKCFQEDAIERISINESESMQEYVSRDRAVNGLINIYRSIGTN